MAGPIASLFVKLGLDAREFTQGVDSAQKSVDGFSKNTGGGLTSLSSKFSNFSSGVVQGFGQAFGQATIRLVGDAAHAVGDFIGGSIEKASDLNETMSASLQIFHENEGGIEDWAKTAATAFGQSQQQAIATAAAFGGLFESVGASSDEAAAKAKDLTQLGSDLASFFNTDVQTAIDSLRSGLVGESEPLRKFNVFLSETAVNAELLAEGQKKVGGQWTEQQKVLARYKIILQQTGAAQGDFARTSDGLANSQRIATAEMENAQAALGQKLLPAQLAFTKAEIAATAAITDFLDAYQSQKDALVEKPKTTFLETMPTRQDVQAALANLDAMANDASRTAEFFNSPFDKALFDANIGGVKDSWQHTVDDLNHYLATTAFDDTGKAITSGLGAGKAALEAYMAGITSNLPRSVDMVATGMAGAFSAIPDAWIKVAAANRQAMLQPFVALGEGIPKSIGTGMDDAAHELDDAFGELKDILKSGLTPDDIAAEAMGKEYIQLFNQGMASEKIGAKETAEATAAVAIKALSDVAENGALDKPGAEAVGKYLGGLFNAGLSSEKVDALLRGQGMSEAAIQGIHSQFPQFFQTGAGAGHQVVAGWNGVPYYKAGQHASSQIVAGVKAYSWYSGGWNTAKAWIGGFASKMDAFNWANLINSTIGPYTRGQSPPPKGPLHYVDKWGYNIGKAWLEGVARGIAGGAGRVMDSMTDLSGLGLATARVASLGVTAPGLAVAASQVQRVEHHHTHDISPDAARALRAAGFDDRRVASMMRGVGDELGYQSTRFSEAPRY